MPLGMAALSVLAVGTPLGDQPAAISKLPSDPFQVTAQVGGRR
jgi:hypothetical protein